MTSGTRPLALQPMGVGEILDAAIRLYRARWKSLMAIVAIALVPITFLQAFLTRSLGSPIPSEPTTVGTGVDSTLITSGVLTLIQLLVIQPFLTAAIAKASADVYLGHPVVVGPTFRYAVSRIHSILWITILLVLVVLLPGIVVVLFAALGATEIAVVSGLLMIVLLVIVFVRFVFGSTVLVVEGKKGSKALRRSWELAKGSFWKILGTLVLAGIMSSVVEGVLSIPGAIAFAAIGPGGWPFLAIGGSLAAILTTPFTTLITVLLYFDLRIRKEAFDLEVMAQEMSSPR
ncbi:MAG TPA: glycerophosphoryl diester phosphodiesterase membrane domain-containing protein [Actinomycetota bacterium]|nr:glycerophosphoryl diester phosphodiesterase membrane domain-containing protein [Actinomycetota bacterium]